MRELLSERCAGLTAAASVPLDASQHGTSSYEQGYQPRSIPLSNRMTKDIGLQ